MCSLAVRKNRYVILPVDFEEAWKVHYLAVLGIHHFINFKNSLASYHSKLLNVQTRRTNSVRFSLLPVFSCSSTLSDR